MNGSPIDLRRREKTKTSRNRKTQKENSSIKSNIMEEEQPQYLYKLKLQETNASSGSGPSPATAKQREYIRMLEERNRLKKKIQSKQISQKERQLQQREKAFTTAFNVTSTATSTVQPTARHCTKGPTVRDATSTPCYSNAERTKTSRQKWNREGNFTIEANGPNFHLQAKQQSDDDNDDDDYLDESFDSFEDEDEDNIVEEHYSTPKSNSPLVKSRKKEQSMLDYLIESTGCSPNVQESIDRIYCDERDHKMEMDIVNDSPSSTPLRSMNTKKHRKHVKVVQAPKLCVENNSEYKNFESPDETSSILLAIQEENAKVKNRLNKDAQKKKEDSAVMKNSLDKEVPKMLEKVERVVESTAECKDPLSSTQSDLLAMVYNLSRSKQKMLVQVLKKFDHSEKEDSDLKELRNSIGDPSVWQQVTKELQLMQKKDSAPGNLYPEGDEHDAMLIDLEKRRMEKLQKFKEDELELEKRMEAKREELAIEELKLQKLKKVSHEIATKKNKEFSICITLISSWGHRKTMGLSEITVYDDDGAEIKIDMSSLQLLSGVNSQPLPKSNVMVRDLPRLFNGVACTNNEKNMWLGRQSDRGLLKITFTTSKYPNRFCIWNYSQTQKMRSTCVRDIEVFVNDRCRWSGSLNQTNESLNECACTWINLFDDKQAPIIAEEKLNVEKAEEIFALQNDEQKSCNTEMDEKPQFNLSINDDQNQSSPIWLNHSPLRTPLPNTRIIPSCGTDSNKLINSPQPKEIQSNRRNQLMSKPANNADSLQMSWDSLELFRKTNRSRLPECISNENDMLSPLYESNQESVIHHVIRESIDNFNNTTNTNNLTTQDDGVLHDISLIPEEKCEQKEDMECFFPIPELPTGLVLKIELLSTWGDPHYIGLNGLDIFDDTGNLILLNSVQMEAFPPNINVLEDYENDPRVVSNLMDGTSNTCDDLHMWLAPYNRGEEHYIAVTFAERVSISMIRIWNYNKSRTHSFRGVREVRFLLDECTIFEGEIRQAPGIISNFDQCSEVILFSMDEVLLNLIETTDALTSSDDLCRCSFNNEDDNLTSSLVSVALAAMQRDRPNTSSKNADTVSNIKSSKLWRQKKTWISHEDYTPKEDFEDYNADGKRPKTAALKKKICPPPVPVYAENTWGDPYYVGLSGVQVLVGIEGIPFPLKISNLDATPRDLHSIGSIGDPRTLDKLIDNNQVTCDDTHMWLIPFKKDGENQLKINLGHEQIIYGIHFWNYNKNLEDTTRGAKQVQIYLDGVDISPENGYFLAKAPGNETYDFGQIIQFANPDSDLFQEINKKFRSPFTSSISSYISPSVRQDYESPLFPQGFIFKFEFSSTWGDPYYIGLNGMEFFDINGKVLDTKPKIITANPYSVSDLGSLTSDESGYDVRIPENIFNGINNTVDASNAWLAPLASSLPISDGQIKQSRNDFYVVFDCPIVISMIRIWNYSKTPERGVREVDLWIDNCHIFSGTFRKAPTIDQKMNEKVLLDDFSQAILFTNQASIIHKFKSFVSYCGEEEQDVMCINEGQVVQESKAMHRKPDPSAEGVEIDFELRPATALCRK